MRRVFAARCAIVFSTLVAVACSPTVPNDAQRTPTAFNNFEGYNQQRAEQGAAAAGRQVAAEERTQSVRPVRITTESTRALIESGQLSELQRQQAAGTAVTNSGVAPVQASPSNPAPVQIANAGISNSNDFEAVSARESIESNAARIQQNREQYRLIQPTALPSRSGSSAPNIVAYALQTQNAKGQQLYTRRGFNQAARFARNCAAYGSNDDAQTDFLARGGPQRDRKGLDPDGDGFACGWDPAPFRLAVRN